MKKLKTFQELIGKTIKKIETDDYFIHIWFSDTEFATIQGNHEWIELDDWNKSNETKKLFNDAKTYE